MNAKPFAIGLAGSTAMAYALGRNSTSGKSKTNGAGVDAGMGLMVGGIIAAAGVTAVGMRLRNPQASEAVATLGLGMLSGGALGSIAGAAPISPLAGYRD